jgi:hypothetical protein
MFNLTPLFDLQITQYTDTMYFHDRYLHVAMLTQILRCFSFHKLDKYYWLIVVQITL